MEYEEKDLSKFYLSDDIVEIDYNEIYNIIKENKIQVDKIEFVVLPKFLEKVNSCLFKDFINLKRIIIDEENRNFSTINGVLYSRKMDILYEVPINYPKNVFEIESKVKTIKREAIALNKNIKRINFCGCIDKFERDIGYACENLEEIIFCDNQKNLAVSDTSDPINNWSALFISCPKLNKIHLPKELETIGSFCFSYNDKIKTIQLPNSLKKIGKNAFFKNNIDEIILSEKLEEIGDEAFAGNHIKKVIIPKSVDKIGYGIFASELEEVTVYDTIERGVDKYNISQIPYKKFDVRVQSNIGFLGVPNFSNNDKNVKWSAFKITVRSFENDEVKFKITMPGKKGGYGKSKTYTFIDMAECWRKNAQFIR